jgi:hypothetical protein
MGEEVGGGEGLCKVLLSRPEGKRPLGRPGLDGRIRLKWIFKWWCGETWIGLI